MDLETSIGLRKEVRVRNGVAFVVYKDENMTWMQGVIFNDITCHMLGSKIITVTKGFDGHISTKLKVDVLDR